MIGIKQDTRFLEGYKTDNNCNLKNEIIRYCGVKKCINFLNKIFTAKKSSNFCQLFKILDLLDKQVTLSLITSNVEKLLQLCSTVSIKFFVQKLISGNKLKGGKYVASHLVLMTHPNFVCK